MKIMLEFSPERLIIIERASQIAGMMIETFIMKTAYEEALKLIESQDNNAKLKERNINE